MEKAQLETRVEGLGDIYNVYSPFDKGLEALRTEGIQYPISARDLVYARIQKARDSSFFRIGDYTIHGLVHTKNALPLFARISPLVEDIGLARKSIKANREGKYFVTDNKNIYEQHLAMAEEDKTKELIERRVLILPSREPFGISPTENPEIFYGIFRDVGEKYFKFIEQRQNNIIVHSVNLEDVDVDSGNGTLLTQLWFGLHDDRSALGGYHQNLLDVIFRLRGVKK